MSRYIFALIIFTLNFSIHNISVANYDLSLKAYNNKKWELAFSECKNMINDDKCLNLLGILYLNGLGISKDINKSYNLFSQAEKLGNKSAIFNLGWMALMGLGEEVNIDKASAYFKESIKNVNNYNKSIVDEELVKESEENLIKLSKNNIIAKFNVFYADYLKLINLVKYKINIEKQYITDITSIDNIEDMMDKQDKIYRDDTGYVGLSGEGLGIQLELDKQTDERRRDCPVPIEPSNTTNGRLHARQTSMYK